MIVWRSNIQMVSRIHVFFYVQEPIFFRMGSAANIRVFQPMFETDC